MGAYLDWNATAPLRPEAREAWLEAARDDWGNPGSIHAWGQRARHRLDYAKAQLARMLGCAAHELVLTSGGTEANAQAIAAALADGGDAVASAVEHSSVLRNAEVAAARVGGRLTTVGVDDCGRVSPAALCAAIDERTRLVCVQLANNELGTVQDLAALVAAARAANPRVRFLADCCQAAGRRAVDLRALGIDYASVAGHKIGAPKGVGLLYARSGAPCAPLLHGGRQQQDRRSGTEDAALAAALAAALTAALAQSEAEATRQRALLERLWARVSAALPDARWLARAADRLPNTMSLAHPGGERDALVMRLDLAGFAVSPGAACMAARGAPSHVIAALGIDERLARSVIRVSIGWGTGEADVDGFAEAYAREVRARPTDRAAVDR